MRRYEVFTRATDSTGGDFAPQEHQAPSRDSFRLSPLREGAVLMKLDVMSILIENAQENPQPSNKELPSLNTSGSEAEERCCCSLQGPHGPRFSSALQTHPADASSCPGMAVFPDSSANGNNITP